MRSIMFLSAFFGILGCTPPDIKITDNTDGQIDELNNLITDYYNIMSSRDWSQYQQFFSEKGTLTTIWIDSTGSLLQIQTSTIEEFVAGTADGPDSQPIFEERPIKIDIEQNAILASAWVKYEAKFGNKRDLLEWTGYDLFSLIKFEEKWKIVSIVFAEDTLNSGKSD